MRHVREEFALVLVRDLELPALVLDFVEETHVRYGDHGLFGEGLQQPNELLLDRSGLVPVHRENTDRLPVPKHWNTEEATGPQHVGLVVLFIEREVLDDLRLSREDHASAY